MSQERPIGIDLGTTFSAAAWVDESGATAMIRNAEGEPLTPSVVLFTDDEVVVGKEARTATTVNPELVAEWVKRDMGQPFYSRQIRGQRLPPEVIQACILRKVKADIVRALGEPDRVVITVPAYFDEPRRKATADAGEMAGLRVLDIVNEPTAAALSFGEMLGYLTPSVAAKKTMTILVYDLGGGTFDVTLLRLAPGKIETIATDGDVQLGGHDWDLRLVEHLANRFHRLHHYDPRQDQAVMNRMLAAAIDAKHALSARKQTIVRIELAGQTMEVPVTREQFEEMTVDLLERTAYTTRQLLTTAGIEWKDVSRLLLVGGSTRMPMVSGMLRKLSGLEPDHTVHPDEAVARGAALYAAHLLAKESPSRHQPTVTITNVNSHSLGVEGIDPETLQKRNVVLIPRNTPLPAKITERFVTRRDDQRSIVVQVLEGESGMPGECTAIGRTVVRNLPPGLSKNRPVDVTFEYASSGRLTVSALVPGTQQVAVLDLERAAGMSGDGIARWKQPIGDAAGFGDFEAMLDDVLDMWDEDDTSRRNRVDPAATASRRQGAASCPDSELTDDDNDAVPLANSHHSQSGVAPVDPDVADESDDAMFATAAVQRSTAAPISASPPLPFSRWLLRIIGIFISGLLGLWFGYLLLCWFWPDALKHPK